MPAKRNLRELQSKDNDQSLTEGERIGKIKMILDEKEKPLGVQIPGLNAGKLFSEWPARSFLPKYFQKRSRKALNSSFISKAEPVSCKNKI
jgi:hypothetical protein